VAIDSGHWPCWPVVRPTDNSASIILTPEQILATRVGHTGWPNGMATRDLDGVAPEQCALSTGASAARFEEPGLRGRAHTKYNYTLTRFYVIILSVLH
jgi:hypothetical protein